MTKSKEERDNETSDKFREAVSAALGEYLRDTPRGDHDVNDFAKFLTSRKD